MITDDVLNLADDLLKGAKEIAAFTGWSDRFFIWPVRASCRSSRSTGNYTRAKAP